MHHHELFLLYLTKVLMCMWNSTVLYDTKTKQNKTKQTNQPKQLRDVNPFHNCKDNQFKKVGFF